MTYLIYSQLSDGTKRTGRLKFRFKEVVKRNLKKKVSSPSSGTRPRKTDKERSRAM